MIDNHNRDPQEIIDIFCKPRDMSNSIFKCDECEAKFDKVYFSDKWKCLDCHNGIKKPKKVDSLHPPYLGGWWGVGNGISNKSP